MKCIVSCLALLSFSLLSPPSLFAAFGKSKTYVYAKDTVFKVSSHQLKKGERLFYGLIPNEVKPSCAGCHYTDYIDTMNWNPSAYDIANKMADKKLEDFINAFEKPASTKMEESHSIYEISEEEAIMLQAYLIKLSEKGSAEKGIVINKLLIFILLTILGLGAVADLLFFHKVKFKALHLLVILFVTIFSLKTMVVEGIAAGRQQGYAPQQPIKFSHQVHAGLNETECLYCHNIAERSKHAGIPETNVCLNCHTVVVEGTNSGKFEIDKIHEANASGEPIEWVKVHNLPDHVFFSHAQHVGVGNLECQECHGPVEEMDVIEQVPDLSMGWCLDCHRTRKVEFETNEYYTHFEEFHKQIAAGEIDSITVADIGGTNCMKCHY